MNLRDTARLTAATMRVIRLITVDDVPGQWWIRDPIDAAMGRYREHHHRRIPVSITGQSSGIEFDEPWWWRYRDGLDCPYCVGMHVALWMLAGETVSRHAPAPVRALWEWATGALALAEVAVNIGQMVGDYDTGDED